MISWVALERMVEGKYPLAAGGLKTAEGKPFRSDAKLLTDADLVAKLRSFGIEMDQPLLERLCREALSAEEIAKALLERRAFKTRQERMDSDWIWICIATLWQRWFPDQPSFEMLDDQMQMGYAQLASDGLLTACRTWLEAWNHVLFILDKASLQSIREFDERFRGSQSLFNWIQDLESELWNAGLRDAQFLMARISMCKAALERFPTAEDLMIENWRRALAESYFHLGETDKAESLFHGWLDADPLWGWGWIGWSDCYRFTRTELRDLNRCEQLLQKGFSVADVRNHEDLAERLASVCEEQGRSEEAAEFRQRAMKGAATINISQSVSTMGKVLRQKTRIDFGGEGLPLGKMSELAAILRGASTPPLPIAGRKGGRNDPCPCGSGKKFKKCCGAGA